MKRVFPPVVLLLAFLLLACSDPVEIAWKGERQVSVYCILTRDSLQTVRLSWVSSLKDGKEEWVDDAQVFIRDKEYAYPGKKVNAGEWAVSMTPEPGKTYWLEIHLPDGKEISAETSCPDERILIDVDVYQPAIWLEEEEENIRQKQPPLAYELGVCQFFNESFYRQFKEMKGATTMHHVMPGLVFLLKDSVCCYISAAFHGRDGQLTPIRYLATNHKESDNFNVTKKQYQSEDYFSPSGNELRDRYDRASFSKYNGLVMHDSFLRIEQTRDYDNGVRNVYPVSGHAFSTVTDFKPVESANKYFTVVGSFENAVFDKNVGPDDEYTILYFSSVSKEYDRYLKYVYERKQKADGDMLTSLYSDNANIPGNIEGGTGIFGAICVKAFSCHRSINRFTGNMVVYEPPRL